MKIVRNYYNYEILFEGTFEECYLWIINQAKERIEESLPKKQKQGDFSIRCRTWIEDDGVCYDIVGEVYKITDDQE